jgi:type II secretory pathway pseudopilin PulG
MGQTMKKNPKSKLINPKRKYSTNLDFRFWILDFSHERGFTYIEMLLYVAILGLMLTTMVNFGLVMIGGSAKSSTNEEVSGNARYISERILYEIRNASGITALSSTSLTLSTFDAPSNPTIIDISGTNIRIKEGSGAIVNLNSTNTSITNFSFTDYRSADTKTKHIGFTFTANANFGSTRQEYTKAIPVEGSGELRSN